MTTGTVTPYRSEAEAGRDGFAQLVRAEWTKFHTVRGWVAGLVAGMLLLALFGFVAGGTGSCNEQNPCPVPTGPGGEEVSDSFYFVRQPLAGDGSITVRVTSLTGLIPALDNAGQGRGTGTGPVDGQGMRMRSGVVPWAKAGIIIRESTQAGSAYAAMMVTGRHGVRMQYDYTEDKAGRPGAVSPASPRWLRLTRTGRTLTGYESADGANWTRVATMTLPGASSTVQAGLFAASPDYSESMALGLGMNVGPALATAAFDNVSLRGAGSGGAWIGERMGGPDNLPSLLSGEFHQSAGAFTVSGSGDIAPDVPPEGLGTTIAQTLAGTFATLIALVVVGAMFVTAEYRRGMIRTTLTASPRRGRVLVAKAVVIGTVAFVAGLAGAGVAVPVGQRLLRGNGVYVFPVTWFTEARVIVGTAAVLAVSAVLAVGIGALVRRSAAAVAAVIMVIVVPYLLAISILPAGVSQWLLRISPAAAFAVQQTIPQYYQVDNPYTPANAYFPLSAWAGFAVLCAWAVLVMGLAVFLIRRRDA
ncbi:MAG TPA: ABC transporter permease subunit [Streptosporangiaceae bacterium]|nr:ABC transporter permease subunit [Streptosporangiaceae bacterium]